MYGLLLALHVIVCLGLIAVVLLQSGKGGGLAGGTFGGAAQTAFGGRGATDFVTRATMILGGAFFLTSLALALMTTGVTRGPSHSLLQEEARKASQQAPPPGQQQPAPGQAPPSGQQAAPPTGPSTPSGTAPATPPKGGR